MTINKKKQPSGYKEKFFEILDDNTYGIIYAPIDPSIGFEVLVEYLLPKNWYSVSGGGAWQVNTEIIYDILWKYSREFRKDVKLHKNEAWSKNTNVSQKKKMKDQTISKVSNIVQFDDMGYPLILCITNDGKQIWIDVSEEYACKGIKEGSLKIIEWKKNV